METERMARRLEALGNATRLDIFRLLVKAEPDGLSVGEVQRALGLPASTLSHHIHRLMQVDLVSQERRSRSLICRANYEAVADVVEYLTAECCTLADKETDAAKDPGAEATKSAA
jgi:DNA-binding transcriptional ArsR family regulator